MDHPAADIGSQRAEQGVASRSGELRRATGIKVVLTGRNVRSVDAAAG
jgi:hypothetical protein